MVEVAFPTSTDFEPAAVKLKYPVESVGEKSAVNEVELFTALGVQVQEAVYGLTNVLATEIQPEIAVPALNVTEPGVLTVAVIATGVPKVAVVALDGKERERVGFICKSFDCDKDPVTVRVTSPELSLSLVTTDFLFSSNFVLAVADNG